MQDAFCHSKQLIENKAYVSRKSPDPVCDPLQNYLQFNAALTTMGIKSFDASLLATSFICEDP
jgi:hypothetical protein